MKASVILLAFAAAAVMAQTTTTTAADASDVTSATTGAATDTSADSSASSATSTDASSGTSATSTGDASSSASSTGTDTSSGTSSGTTTTASSSGASSTATASSTSVSHLSNLPTIAGATIPSIVIPYTAAAPFMQKSNYPEGTVFICVGAVLAFLGACVLAWRAVVAYSINRSVKKAALASIMASDSKASAWLGGTAVPTKYGPGGKLYKQATDGSYMSLEALTADGKKVESRRGSHAPTRKDQKRDPSGLFFSPTAAMGSNAPPMSGLSSPPIRNSAYLPAGYYASSAAQAAGGAASTTLGGNHSPGRSPQLYSHTTPPESPIMHPPGSNRRPAGSAARDNSHARASTASMLSPKYPTSNPSSTPLYTQPSTSSLAVGTGRDNVSDDTTLPGQRAPSAYFDDLLENHGNGPRGR